MRFTDVWLGALDLLRQLVAASGSHLPSPQAISQAGGTGSWGSSCIASLSMVRVVPLSPNMATAAA